MRGKHRKYLPYVFTEQGVSMVKKWFAFSKLETDSFDILRRLESGK